jgi:hypothetical protein
MQAIGIVIIAIVAAVVYGILHDQVPTSRRRIGELRRDLRAHLEVLAAFGLWRQ